MKARKGTLLVGIIAAAVLTGADAEGKRLAPKAAAPVVADGVRYTAPPFGAFRGRSQNGGYVDAEDVRSGKLIWSRMIYRVQYEPNLEKDVQDVFITRIKVKRGRLFVTTERAEEFEMDLRSGSVRARTRLGPRIEVPPAAQVQVAGQKESRMDSVVEDAKKSLTWIAGALSSSGYVADFTPASLWEIDRFFDEQTQGGNAKPGGLLSE